MQDTDLQEIITQEKDNETAEADKIKYQISLVSEEAAFKLRTSVAGMSGTPLKGMVRGEENRYRSRCRSRCEKRQNLSRIYRQHL